MINLTLSCSYNSLEWTNLFRYKASLTLQDVDSGSVVSLLDDAAAFRQAGGIHAVHDGEDLQAGADQSAARWRRRGRASRLCPHLPVLQMFHEVVVH